jgi:hypothetical protein
VVVVVVVDVVVGLQRSIGVGTKPFW